MGKCRFRAMKWLTLSHTRAEQAGSWEYKPGRQLQASKSFHESVCTAWNALHRTLTYAITSHATSWNGRAGIFLLVQTGKINPESKWFAHSQRVDDKTGPQAQVQFPQFSSVQSLSRVRLFVLPWTAARQASLSITNSWSLPKLMSSFLIWCFSSVVYWRFMNYCFSIGLMNDSNKPSVIKVTTSHDGPSPGLSN